jgi:hypothetical protein
MKAAGLPQVSGLPGDWLSRLVGLMHGVTAASLVFTLLLALLVALWLRPPSPTQSARTAVLGLRLGRVLVLLGGLSLFLLVAGANSLGAGSLLVLATGFVAQACAVLHWLAERRGWAAVWPLALYGPLILGPSVAGVWLLALATIGLLDNFVALRRPPADVV